MENSSAVERMEVEISGVVQGVGFRYFTAECAGELEITGWVKNCLNGDVLCQAQGNEHCLDEFLAMLKKGPFGARVSRCMVRSIPVVHDEHAFHILK